MCFAMITMMFFTQEILVMSIVKNQLNFFKPEEEIHEDQQIPLHGLLYKHYAFLMTTIFVAVHYTTLLSVHSLFYNPFLSTNFEELGGATKTFVTTVTTIESMTTVTTTVTTTESMTTVTTTESMTTVSATNDNRKHTQKQKKTTENTQNSSMCLPTSFCFLFCFVLACDF